MNKKTFYITTPLYYPSDNLHIGHTYSTVLADVFNRYKKQNNYDTFFLVGSDEHGQKIENKAREINKKPIEFVNEIVKKFKYLWKELGIEYDVFERTTNKQHESLCKDIFSFLLENNYVYKGEYKGIYCKSCEEFLTSTQINEKGECKISLNKIEMVNEESYFFKVSKFSNFLLKLFNEKDFLFPIERRKEMINNFIKPGLSDLSITRISFNWGIPIREDKKHILYVWIDALSGYLSGIKYKVNNEIFNKYWGKDTEIIQIIGKEITRFHSIYWPSLLESLNLRQPNKLISHGWITLNNNKMSKSLGNIIDPHDLIKEYGIDALRYFLSTGLKIETDNNYNSEILKNYYNANLANNYGNLISRVSNMIKKYFSGNIKNIKIDFNSKIIIETKKTIKFFKAKMNDYNIYEANKILMQLFSLANKYIEDKKPWTLFGKDNNILKTMMINLTIVIIVGTFLLKPFLIKKYKDVFNQFDIDEKNINYDNLDKMEFIKNIKINKADILFKRK